MTKKCAFEGCESDIEEWQTYCVTHYVEVKKQDNMRMQPQKEQVVQPVQQRQPMPQQRPIQQTAREEPMGREEYQQRQEEYHQRDFVERKPMPVQQQQQQPRPIAKVQPEAQKPIQNKKFEIPVLGDRDRLIVKQVAFKGAIDLMSQTDFLDRDFDTLIDEIRTLTANFFKIIVEYNEREDV